MARRAEDKRLPPEKRGPTPPERKLLEQQPDCDLQMLIVIGAWKVLDADRPYALRPMAVPKAPPIYVPFRGEIPSRAVAQYARDEGMSTEAARLLIEVIAYLDADRAARELNEMKRRMPR
jgi:hypothetical protein